MLVTTLWAQHADSGVSGEFVRQMNDIDIELCDEFHDANPWSQQ